MCSNIGHRAFCPVCNKGRQLPLTETILSPTHIEEVVICNLCKRLFKGEKEVTVEIREKEIKKGTDIGKLIPDHYRCPICHKICIGATSWASHTWSKHHVRVDVFEERYGKPEYSFFGTDFKKFFNPSKRENKNEN